MATTTSSHVKRIKHLGNLHYNKRSKIISKNHHPIKKTHYSRDQSPSARPNYPRNKKTWHGRNRPGRGHWSNNGERISRDDGEQRFDNFGYARSSKEQQSWPCTSFSDHAATYDAVDIRNKNTTYTQNILSNNTNWIKMPNYEYDMRNGKIRQPLHGKDSEDLDTIPHVPDSLYIKGNNYDWDNTNSELDQPLIRNFSEEDEISYEVRQIQVPNYLIRNFSEKDEISYEVRKIQVPNYNHRHDLSDNFDESEEDFATDLSISEEDIEHEVRQQQETTSETEDDIIDYSENHLPVEHDRPTLRVFREVNRQNGTYRLHLCIPLTEGDWVPIGYQENLNIRSLLNLPQGHTLTQEDEEEEEDRNKDDEGLSLQTISEKLQTRIYNKVAHDGNAEAEICVICQDDYEKDEKLGRLGCGHEYHADCITTWLFQKNKCPVCNCTVSPGEETQEKIQ